MNHTDTFSIGRDNQDILIDPTPFSLAVRLVRDEGGPYRITTASQLVNLDSSFIFKIAVQVQIVPLFLSVAFMMIIEDVSFSVSTGVMPLFKRTLKSLSDLKMEPVPGLIFHTILYSPSTEQFSITGAPPIGDKTRPGTSLNTMNRIINYGTSKS